MSWEERLFDLFDDLEQQAEGLALQSRDAEAGELARAHYAEVDLASRWHASTGASVELTLPGLDPVRGVVVRVGNGWCLLAAEGQGGGEWVLSLRHLLSARGVSDGAVAAEARSVASRVGIGSALRTIAEAGDPVVLVRADGRSRGGRLGRVGADFIELVEDGRGTSVLPLTAVAAVRRA